MIQSFKDKRTRRLFEGERVPAFQSFARQAEKRLRVLDAADRLEALIRLPSNRFKALGGDRLGQYSIGGTGVGPQKHFEIIDKTCKYWVK